AVVNTPVYPKITVAMINKNVLFLNIRSSFCNCGFFADFIFGLTKIRPISATIPRITINQHTERQSNNSPKYDPTGTPSIAAIVSPAWTAAIPPVRLWGPDIYAARDIHKPKKGACIIADNTLDINNILKFIA